VSGDGTFQLQTVDIDVHAFFRTQIIGILYGRAQQLVNRGRHSFVSERQSVESIFHPTSFDQIQDETGLLRRDAHVTGLSSKFHNASPLRLRRRWRRRGSRSAGGRWSSWPAGHASRFGRYFRRRSHRVSLELPGETKFAQLV